MRAVTTPVKTSDWRVRHDGRALLDVLALQFRTVHALVKLGFVESELIQSTQRAGLEDLRRPTVLNHEVAPHQELQEAAHGKELQCWGLELPTLC